MENSAFPNKSGIKWNINNRNRLRLLYLLRYLMENTDSEHPPSTMELTEILRNEYDINVNQCQLQYHRYGPDECCRPRDSG